MSESSSRSRRASIDILRIVSMLLIIILHMINKGARIDNIMSVQDVSNLYIVAFASCAVNVFVLISAYFLLDDNKLKIKKVVIMVIELWLTSIFASAFVFGIYGNLNATNVVYALFPFLTRRNWFVNVYILLYLIHPVINRAISGLNRSQYKVLLVTLIAAFSVLPTIIPIANWTFDAQYGNSIVWFVTLYAIMGYYKKYGLFRSISFVKRIIWILVICMLMVTSYILIESIARKSGAEAVNAFKNQLFYFDSLPVLILSLLLFSLFERMEFQVTQKSSRTIAFLAMNSLGVYIIHDNYMLRTVLWNSVIPISKIARFPYAAAVYLLIAMTVYFVCAVLYAGVHRLIMAAAFKRLGILQEIYY